MASISIGESIFSTSTNNNSIPGVTCAQWQKLLDLLGNSSLQTNNDRLSGKSLRTSWKIYSGASHQGTRNKDMFSDMIVVPVCPVGLPDGTQVVKDLFLKTYYMCHS